MNLSRISEHFYLQDTNINNWIAQGNIVKESNGSIQISISVYSNQDEFIGRVDYIKPVDNEIKLDYTVMEFNRDMFITYTDSLIEYVLEQLK